MIFPEDFIQQVREENDIVDVISNYVSLKKGGANFKGLCPFHSEKTPSFSVSPSKQIFHCFGCGEGGDIFHFLMKYERLSFPDAVRAMAERCGKPIPESQPSPQDLVRKKEKARIYEINAAALEFYAQERTQSKKVQVYLKERGVSEESIATFKIGCAPDSWDALSHHLKGMGFQEKEMETAGLILQRKKGDGYYDRFRNRVIFPIMDIYNRVLGFGGRVLDDSTPKYLNSPETPVFDKGSNLYGMHRSFEAIRKQDYVILVEGYMDVITVHQNGILNVVATLGTSLTQGHIRKLRRYTRNLALFFDADTAGLKAAKRCFDLCVPEGMKVKVITLAQNEDPDSFLRKHGKKGFSEMMAQAKPIMDFMIEQKMGKRPPDELEKKVAVAEGLTPLLSEIPNMIEQELYIKKTASLLGIDTQTLQDSVRSILAKKQKKRNPTTRDDEKVQKSLPTLEGKFVGLLMNHPDLIPEIKKSVSLDYFSDPDLRGVVRQIFDIPDKKLKKENLHAIIQTDDSGFAGQLSKFSFIDQKLFDLQGFIERLRLEYLKRKKKELQKKVEVAEKQGKDQEADHLIQEKKELDMEVSNLQQKLEKLGSQRRIMAE